MNAKERVFRDGAILTEALKACRRNEIVPTIAAERAATAARRRPPNKRPEFRPLQQVLAEARAAGNQVIELDPHGGQFEILPSRVE